jgi:O-antigen/teichoic acid export membrane protein
MVQTVLFVAIAGSVGVVIVGPFALGLIGGEYRTEGEGLLYLAALFIPLSAVTAVYEGLGRVDRRLGLIFAVRAGATILILSGAYLGTERYGVIGVGFAYLAVEAVSAAVLLGPVAAYLRRNKRDPSWLARSTERDQDAVVAAGAEISVRQHPSSSG